MTDQTLIERLRHDIGNVSSTVDERQIRQKSHDFHWYSPVLTQELQNFMADVVVEPKSEDEIAAVVTAAVRTSWIPLTLRGGGTGNYGQSVPLKGGVLLDMTGINKIVAVEPGSIRVQAGAVIQSALEAALATGQRIDDVPVDDALRHDRRLSRRRLCRHRLGASRHHSQFGNDPVSEMARDRGPAENSDALGKRRWLCFSFLGYDRDHPGGSTQAGAG